MLQIIPLTFREASAFVAKYHRHNKPPRGCKFCIGVIDSNKHLRGVAQCGRPVARHFDDKRTLEINRTCTDGTRNANSCLYGASIRIAKAMGYKRIITYTQQNETGASLRAVGFVMVKKLAARSSWADASKKLRHIRDTIGTGNVDRVLWEIRFGA